MMNKIKIALDVDGVLLNFMQTISGYIENTYSLVSRIPYASTQYSLYDRFSEETILDLDFDSIKDSFEHAGLWKTLEAMPHSDSIPELFNNPIFDVYFVTSIHPHLKADRHINLQNMIGCSIDLDKIICIPLGESKQPYIKQIQPDYFIEDNLHHLAACAGKHLSIWIDHNENYYDLTLLNNSEIQTVFNFNEALTLIKKDMLHRHSHEKLIEQMSLVLTDDLLTPLYRNMERKSQTEGHCYACSEALYHLLGGAKAGLTPCVASSIEDGQKVTHWWLKDKDNHIIDPTAEQFYAIGKTPPYHLGKGSGFLTKYPSKRAKTILERMFNFELIPENHIKNSKKMKY